MSELWVPQPDKTPDVENLFDMMILFQEQIDITVGREAKIHQAVLALRALSVGLKRMNEDERQITLVTDLAIIDDTEEEKRGIIVENVGFHGAIEDVHGVNVGERLPMSISLGIDVFTVFQPGDPDNSELALSTAKAPIGRVHYIETHAA